MNSLILCSNAGQFVFYSFFYALDIKSLKQSGVMRVKNYTIAFPTNFVWCFVMFCKIESQKYAVCNMQSYSIWNLDTKHPVKFLLANSFRIIVDLYSMLPHC